MSNIRTARLNPNISYFIWSPDWYLWSGDRSSVCVCVSVGHTVLGQDAGWVGGARTERLAGWVRGSEAADHLTRGKGNMEAGPDRDQMSDWYYSVTDWSSKQKGRHLWSHQQGHFQWRRVTSCVSLITNTPLIDTVSHDAFLLCWCRRWPAWQIIIEMDVCLP